jgi:hypothetical protein
MKVYELYKLIDTVDLNSELYFVEHPFSSEMFKLTLHSTGSGGVIFTKESTDGE